MPLCIVKMFETFSGKKWKKVPGWEHPHSQINIIVIHMIDDTDKQINNLSHFLYLVQCGVQIDPSNAMYKRTIKY